MIVEQSFGVQIFRISHIRFDLCLMKKEERREEEERKKSKSKYVFAFDFLHCDKKPWDFGTIFYIRIAKGFHL